MLIVTYNHYFNIISLLLNGEELKRLTNNTETPKQTSDDIKGNITTSRTNEKHIKSQRTTNDAAYVIQTNIKCEPTLMSSSVNIVRNYLCISYKNGNSYLFKIIK